MMKQLVSLFSTQPKSRLMQRPRRTILKLECLEERWTPATLDWYGAAGANWNLNTNWRDEATNMAPANPPAAADTVVFKGNTAISQNTNCTIDVSPTVTNFTVQSGYTQTITIATGKAVTISSALTFDGGTNATIAGGGAAQAVVTVSGNLIWTAGTFNNLAVTASGTASIISGTGAKSVTTTALTNAGTMTWSSGDIPTAGTTPTITNKGTFQMQSAGTLGTAGVGTFTNTNSGMTQGTINKLGTETSTVAIPFKNLGALVIQAGTAKFTDTQQQGESDGKTTPTPLTQMNGGSLNTGTNTYVVFDGVFEGTGTVTGNLTNNGGDLKLGLGGAPGGLTVTGNFVQSLGTFNVYINATGTCSTLNANAVNLTAGTLKVHNTPYTGTASFTFLTSPAAIQGDFAGVAYDTQTWGNPLRKFVAGKSPDSRSYILTNQLA